MCTKRALKPGKHEQSEGRQVEARLATTGAKSSLAKLQMRFESSNRHVSRPRKEKAMDELIALSANNYARFQCRRLLILQISFPQSYR